MSEIDLLIDEYSNWIKDHIYKYQHTNLLEIAVPFLDRHNDFIKIYIVKRDDEYILFDHGNTIHDLESSGVMISTSKRKELFNEVMNGFSIKQKEKELYVKATRKDFPQKLHFLIQGIMAINDLYYMGSPKESLSLSSQVKMYLANKKIEFEKDFKREGKSGLQKFDYYVPETSKYRESIIQTITVHQIIDKSKIFVFNLRDVYEEKDRKPNSIALMNVGRQKKDRGTSRKDIDAASDLLKGYGINPVIWQPKLELEYYLSKTA